jgi:uncharacterized protein YndB with AHSA1/START domain
MEEKKIAVHRIYDAPVELVWKTWTEPELVKRWWGPDMFTCPYAKIDFREGGVSVVMMRAPEKLGGQDSYCVWAYTKIVHLESIEYIQNMSDKDGNIVSPVSVGMPPDFPTDIRTEVIFKSLSANRTEMTVTEYADMGQMSHFAMLGLEQCMDKLGRIFSE